MSGLSCRYHRSVFLCHYLALLTTCTLREIATWSAEELTTQRPTTCHDWGISTAIPLLSTSMILTSEYELIKYTVYVTGEGSSLHTKYFGLGYQTKCCRGYKIYLSRLDCSALWRIHWATSPPALIYPDRPGRNQWMLMVTWARVDTR